MKAGNGKLPPLTTLPRGEHHGFVQCEIFRRTELIKTNQNSTNIRKTILMGTWNTQGLLNPGKLFIVTRGTFIQACIPTAKELGTLPQSQVEHYSPAMKLKVITG